MVVLQATFIFLATIVLACPVLAQTETETRPAPNANVLKENKSKQLDVPFDVLAPQVWKQVDESVDRAFKWLITQQHPDGSFDTQPLGQPGIKSRLGYYGYCRAKLKPTPDGSLALFIG